MMKLASLAAAGILAISTGSALAAPGGKNAEEIVLQCGSEDITVIVNGGGFSPGHVVDSNVKFIPTLIEIEGTFTPTEGEPQSFSDLMEKGRAPRNMEILTCTFDQTFTSPEGTVVLQGTVEGFLNR